MKGTPLNCRALTPDELEALRTFAARAGRFWKKALKDAWKHGAHAPDALVYELRKSHGLTWLAYFNLTHAERKSA